MMNPYLAILICVRLGFGLVLFMACAVCCSRYCDPKLESIQAGAAIGAIATFCCAIWFTIGALDAQLWREDGDRAEREPGRGPDAEADAGEFRG